MAAGVRDLLSRSAFRRLYATRLAGQFTDGVFEASLAGFVLFNPEQATTAPRIAGAAAVLLLPYSIVGPVAGVVIDRVNRRRVLVVANLVRAALVALAAAVMAMGYAGLGFFAVALLVFSVSRFVLSALSAATPATVPRGDLVEANALSTTSGTAATILGVGVGSLLTRILGGGGAGGAGGGGGAGGAGGGSAGTAVAAAALYVVVVVVARRLPRRLLQPPPGDRAAGARHELRRAVRDVAAGARHIWARPVARDALAAVGAHRFLFGLSTVATVLVYRNLFAGERGLVPGGAAGLAEVVVAGGGGAVLGAVLTPIVTRRVRPSAWMVTLFGIAAVTEVVLGAPYRPATFLAAALVFGVVSQGSKICVDSLVQRSVEDSFRGRAFAFYDQLFNLAYVAAAAVGAMLLPANGKSYAVLGLVAAGYALVAVVFGAASARRPPAAVGADVPDGQVTTLPA